MKLKAVICNASGSLNLSFVRTNIFGHIRVFTQWFIQHKVCCKVMSSGLALALLFLRSYCFKPCCVQIFIVFICLCVTCEMDRNNAWWYWERHGQWDFTDWIENISFYIRDSFKNTPFYLGCCVNISFILQNVTTDNLNNEKISITPIYFKYASFINVVVSIWS